MKFSRLATTTKLQQDSVLRSMSLSQLANFLFAEVWLIRLESVTLSLGKMVRCRCSYRCNENFSFFFVTQPKVEQVEESDAYWYSQHCPHGIAFKNCYGSGCVNTASDISFGKEKPSLSSVLGNEKESKTGDSYQPLNPLIGHAITGTCRCWRHSFWPLVVSELFCWMAIVYMYAIINWAVNFLFIL